VRPVASPFFSSSRDHMPGFFSTPPRMSRCPSLCLLFAEDPPLFFLWHQTSRLFQVRGRHRPLSTVMFLVRVGQPLLRFFFLTTSVETRRAPPLTPRRSGRPFSSWSGEAFFFFFFLQGSWTASSSLVGDRTPPLLRTPRARVLFSALTAFEPAKSSFFFSTCHCYHVPSLSPAEASQWFFRSRLRPVRGQLVSSFPCCPHARIFFSTVAHFFSMSLPLFAQTDSFFSLPNIDTACSLFFF